MPRPPQRNDASPRTFDVSFPARIDILPAQRHDFAGWLRHLGVDEEAAEDSTVVFSELTTNAVHGSPDAASHVNVRAECEDDELLLDVRNPTAPDGYRARRWDLDDPLREGGRGLLIVRALVDELDVSHDGGDLAVRCRWRVRLGEGGA